MKTVLITAGANGIGLTMALAFQAAGYRVWVTDVDAPMIASLPAGIRGSHVDAGHEMGMEALFADIAQTWGGWMCFAPMRGSRGQQRRLKICRWKVGISA
jgi:NAD(P)-dependent dehydrogenase (short-subunit alcohol dehydrogenase family)